ncbi:uncharacterized protein LOC128551831, partial [Mercenaria mercenaria]|uniref:uncharacterized protein LOC128551831 n=1 Tax=Mercenaria mercenaria TaxID=6596 RepID=UPI00234F2F32
MSDNPEATAYIRLIAMYIDLATDTVLKVFFYLTPNQDIDTFFTSTDVRKKLEGLFLRRRLNKKEYEIVTRPRLSPKNFDISLLITLLSNLYANILPAPMNGWNSAVNPRDHTIAADLLRLRNIRNKLVAHNPRAGLEEFKFEHLWNKVENILVRLIQQVDPGSEASLKEKIGAYRTCHLDPTDDRFKKYLEKLQEWYDEASKLQEKVEDLLEKTDELILYFRNRPRPYCRYIRLLIDGGKLVLCGLLEKKLSSTNQTLQNILHDKNDMLEEMIVDEEVLNQLISHSNDVTIKATDTKTWDILVIASVIICLQDEPGDEDISADVRTIMEARRNYAEIALISLDHEKYMSCYSDLLSSIIRLSSVLSADIRAECKAVIANCNKDSHGSTEYKKYFEQLKAHGSQIKSITDTYKVLDLNIVTLGNNEEKKKVVEDTVARVWQAALDRTENSSDFRVVRNIVDRILEDIDTIPGVEVGEVETRCILLFLRCHSWHALLLLLEYFCSCDFKEHLQCISSELTDVYDETVVMQGHLNLECLLEVFNNPLPVYDKTPHHISIPIACDSPEGMRQVLKVLHDEQTKNRFNEIAETLSATCGGSISLAISSDAKGFKDVFEET